MSKDEPIKRKLDQVRALQQRKQAWAGSGRIRWMWITPRNKPPYRPYMIMFVTDDGKTIFRTKVMDNSPTSEQMLDELLQAMRHPALGAGWAHRPSVVYLDDADHVAALSPWLADVGVRCEYRDRLPAIESVLYSFERRADKREPIPGLLKIPGVTPPLVGHLYELALNNHDIVGCFWPDF